MKIKELCQYLDEFLQTARYRDYAPNGLQVQGREDVERIVTGVTASAELIRKAIELNADAVLVHHGYFWNNEDSRVVGMKAVRLKALLANDINLLAYHLPLDGHAVVGNNAQLGRLLELKAAALDPDNLAQGLVWHAHLDRPQPVLQFCRAVAENLGREPLLIAGGPAEIQHVAWCTGAAQNYLQAVSAYQVDLYLSGEISESTVHVARECGLHYVAAGHHATERYGVKALGEHLADKFEIQHDFIDLDNPV